MLNETIPANSEKPCGCCGRLHRKLVLTDCGRWVGKTCAEDIKLFKKQPDINSATWYGYERKHAKVAAMMGQ